MPTWLIWTSRILATALVVTLAGFGGRWLWIHYDVEPWTRDGRVRADVVIVSPDVYGLVTEIHVKDGQTVRAGDVLLVVDRVRYELAARQAEAAVVSDGDSLPQGGRGNPPQRPA